MLLSFMVQKANIRLYFLFYKEENLLAQLDYSSFRGVATSMLQKISVFTSSGNQVSQAERRCGVN